MFLACVSIVLESSGAWNRSLAVSLLNEMADLGAPPDSVTYASAMLACERAKQWHQVLRIMDQVMMAAEAMDRGRTVAHIDVSFPTACGAYLLMTSRVNPPASVLHEGLKRRIIRLVM